MTIKGGVVIDKNDIEVSFNIEGGKPYKRVYNDQVSSAISNFKLIGESLTELKSDNLETYLRQLKLLFQYAHVELLNGNNVFQTNYNLWLLNGYVRMLLETKDMKLITQLLNLDSILYSVEEAGVMSDESIDTDFKLPNKLSIANDKKIKIAIPEKESASALIKSLNVNIQSLIEFIGSNKNAFKKIYDEIVKTVSKYVH